MRERMGMFPTTRYDIERLLARTENELAEITAAMKDYGADGDAMDDRFMWELMRKKELAVRRQEELSALLSPDTPIISTAPEELKATVGHQVTIRITGENEQIGILTFTIGTNIDAFYNSHNLESKSLVVSNESPLARTVQGAAVGETRNGSNGPIKQVEVLAISPSPLLKQDQS